MGRGAAGRPAAAFRIPACLTRDNPRAGVKRPSLFGIPEANFLEAKAAAFFRSGRVFLKRQSFFEMARFFESVK